MTDAFGREIYYLRLSVTERCNLRCRYCMPADGICKKSHEEMLTEDEMILAVEAAAALGFKKLRITGGEPLVKKNLLSICSRAAAVDGIEEICLTTNGTLLPHLAKPLREAGVSRVNISLDTLDREKYAYMTRRGALSSALVGIESAIDAGFTRIKITTVLIGGFNRMDNMAIGLTSYCKEHGVTIPIFCRMCGTMQEEGIRIMEEHGFSTFNVLTEAVEAVAKAAKEG